MAAFNLDRTTSYASEVNLHTALRKLGFHTARYWVAYRKDGRVTAIFPGSEIQGGDVTMFARHGFLTIG